MFYMHVNYLEWLDDLPEITKRCAAAGFEGIELRGFDRTGNRELEAYLDHASDAASAAGLTDVVFGCPSESASADTDKRQATQRTLQTVIHHAGERGYTRLNVFASGTTAPGVAYHQFDKHGSALVTNEQRERTATFFQEAGAVAAKCGVMLCFETHNCYQHDLSDLTRQMIEQIGHPNVAVNFDFGNIYLHPQGETMEVAIDTLCPHIKYVHLKNMMSLSAFTGSSIYRGTPLSDGDINHEQLISKLLTAGYAGPWAIENVMPGDKHHLASQDLAYLKDVLQRVEKRLGVVCADPSHAE